MRRGVNPDLGLAILRVVVGVIFIAHGSPRIFGGMESTVAYLGSLDIPLPVVVAWVTGVLEFAGGIALVAGFLVTPVSLLLVVRMMADIVVARAARGFYVVGPEANGGLEFGLLLTAALLMLVFGGPGLAAMDSRKQPL